MNKLTNHIVFTLTTIVVIFFLSSCGGGVSNNKYLGELPGLAKKYSQEIDDLKTSLKASTDINESFGLKKELDNLKDEAKDAIKDYLAKNTLAPLPFEQNAEYPFTINEVTVDPKNKSISSLQLDAQIKFDKSLTAEELRNMFGGFGSAAWAYAKVLDSKGNYLGKSMFKLSVPYSNEKYRVKEGTDYTMKGTIFKLGEMEDFAKLVFISKDDYNKQK